MEMEMIFAIESNGKYWNAQACKFKDNPTVYLEPPIDQFEKYYDQSVGFYNRCALVPPELRPDYLAKLINEWEVARIIQIEIKEI